MGLGYPIVLDLSGREVVVVGGGNVALRKVRGLIDSGAKGLRVVSPKFHPEMPNTIHRIAETYRAEHLHGANLVFAATDSPQVNDAVVRDGHQIGALVCRADVDEDNAGDFSTPAMWRNGSMLLAVSSGGSPALSARVRDQIANTIDPRWIMMTEAMKTLRPVIRKSLVASRRQEAFRELCTEPALYALAQGGVPQLKSWLHARFPELEG